MTKTIIMIITKQTTIIMMMGMTKLILRIAVALVAKSLPKQLWPTTLVRPTPIELYHKDTDPSKWIILWIQLIKLVRQRKPTNEWDKPSDKRNYDNSNFQSNQKMTKEPQKDFGSVWHKGKPNNYTTATKSEPPCNQTMTPSINFPNFLIYHISQIYPISQICPI